MLKNVTELVVRTADLLEAEGRALRYHSVRVGMAIGFVIVASLLMLASVLALLAALFVVLKNNLHEAAAFAIVGVVGLGIAAWLWRIAVQIGRGVGSDDDRDLRGASSSSANRSGEDLE